MGIINGIPNEWRLLIITQRQQYVYSPSNETIQINKDGVSVDRLKVTSKMIYNEFKHKKQTTPSAQIKLNQKYPKLFVEWKKIYCLPFTVTTDTTIREFQYKLLNNIVFTNDKLFRFKVPLRRKFVGLFPPNSVAEYRVVSIFT